MGLQVGDHEAFKRREWRAERIGWLLTALLVVVAALGLLGPGPLSWTHATAANELVRVDYQRFGHLEADDKLTVTFAPAAVTDRSISLELAQEWVEAVDIDTITPQPDQQVATPYGLRLTVATEPGTEVTVQISYRAGDAGPIDAGVRHAGVTIPFHQLIYP